MELKESKTAQNLKDAFAGESMAFLPPLDLNEAALALDKHFGLPSPFFLSPHLPIL